MTRSTVSVDISVNFGQGSSPNGHSNSHGSPHQEPGVSGRGGFSTAQRSRPYIGERVASADHTKTAANTVHECAQSPESKASLQPSARYRGPNHFSSIFVENDLLDGNIEPPQPTPLDQQPFGRNIPLERKSQIRKIECLLNNSEDSKRSFDLCD